MFGLAQRPLQLRDVKGELDDEATLRGWRPRQRLEHQRHRREAVEGSVVEASRALELRLQRGEEAVELVGGLTARVHARVGEPRRARLEGGGDELEQLDRVEERRDQPLAHRYVELDVRAQGGPSEGLQTVG